MRRLFILFLLALSLSIALFFLLGKGGYVLIFINGFRIEMPFVVALLLNLSLLWICYFVASLSRWLFSSRRSLRSWIGIRRQKQERSRTTKGLISFFEGRWDCARKELVQSAGSADTPFINYLFAARASAALRDERSVDEFLRRAEVSAGGADIAIDLTQAELQIDSGQYEQALAILLRAQNKSECHPVVLQMLSSVYWHLQDWQKLMSLLPTLKKTAAVSSQQITLLQIQAACGMLLSAATCADLDSEFRDTDRGARRMALESCWNNFSIDITMHYTVLECYIQQLISLQQLSRAERELRQRLRHAYSSSLASLYGRVAGCGKAEQLDFSEKLLRKHPSDAGLLLALARISSAHEGPQDKNTANKTCRYLEKSLSLNRCSEVLLEFARFYAAHGDADRSVKFYAEGISAWQTETRDAMMSGSPSGIPLPSLGDAFPLLHLRSVSRHPSALFSSLGGLQPLRLR